MTGRGGSKGNLSAARAPESEWFVLQATVRPRTLQHLVMPVLPPHSTVPVTRPRRHTAAACAARVNDQRIVLLCC